MFTILAVMSRGGRTAFPAGSALSTMIVFNRLEGRLIGRSCRVDVLRCGSSSETSRGERRPRFYDVSAALRTVAHIYSDAIVRIGTVVSMELGEWAA